MSTSTLTSTWRWLRDDPRRTDVLVAVILLMLITPRLLLSPEWDEFDAGWPEVVAGIGAFVLVLFRRWNPPLLLAVSVVWTVGHSLVWGRPSPMVLAVVVLLFTVCVRISRRHAILLGAVVGLVLYAILLYANHTSVGDDRALIGLVWSALAVGVADAVRSWRQYRATAAEQLRATVAAVEAQTRSEISEERLSIARELHDLLAHNLSVINVQTGAALHLLRDNPDQAEESLVAARTAGRTVLDELRVLLGVLRDDSPSPTSPTSALPTIDRIGELVDTMRDAQLAVEWQRTGTPRPLAPAVSLAAYRIAQEGLTNAARHGDGAARLLTEWGVDGLTIRVSNTVAAQSSDTDPGDVVALSGGHGLVGMRERATANGGRFESAERSGEFVVTAWLPSLHGVGESMQGGDAG